MRQWHYSTPCKCNESHELMKQDIHDIKHSTIRSKINRKMTLQATLIAIVAILSIGFTSVILEQFLVREALKRETQHFWDHYEKDPNFPVPNTDNLKGYLTTALSDEGVPESIQGYGLGFQKIDGQVAHSVLYNSERNGLCLHLLFDGKSVLRLALFFGVFPLTLVLVLIYVAAWWVYRESNYLVSPIVWLANKFDKFDPAEPGANLEDISNIPGDMDWEIEKLTKSFSSYALRIRRFVERERAFTRDASHEFRTPLTVIKMAADILLSEQELDDYSKKFVKRIKGSAQDMEELIDAFLILARETDKEFEDEHLVMSDVVETELKSAQLYLDDKPVKFEIDQQYPLELFTAQKVVSIVLGNLIRNAVLYTNEGIVKVTILEKSVLVEDTGIGMTKEQIKKIFQPYYRAKQDGKTERKGYGVGLTIVKRLANRFDWLVDVESDVDKGTRVEVVFKN